MVILSNIGARVDLNIARNAAFARTFTYKANGTVQNLTGYTFTAQIKTAAGATAATFTTVIVNAAQGTFSVALSSAQTAGLVAGTVYEWSLEQTVSSVTSELVRGFVQVVVNEVTT